MAFIDVSGVIQEDDKILCSQCNAVVSEQGSVTFVCHWDGEDDYGYQFVCNKCGNPINQRFSRDSW